MEKLSRQHLKEVVTRHGMPVLIISDRYGRFASQFWQSLHKVQGTLLDFSMAYHPQTDGQSERTIQTLEEMLRAYVIDFRKSLYGRKCRSPVYWVKFGDAQLTGPEIVYETTENIIQIKKRIQAAPIPLDEIQIDDKLNFIEEPVEIMDHEVKHLKQSRIPIVKVRWNSRQGPEFTWEREDQMKKKVIVQQVHGRQGQSYSGIGYKSNATTSGGNNASGQARVVKCYNCQCEGHMARQCIKPKRPKNEAWNKEKAMLAKAQEAGQILDEEQLAFLTDLRVPDGQAFSWPIFPTMVLTLSQRKRYVPQKELSADEAVWYHMLNPSTKFSISLPVKIEDPKELPKVSLVNGSLKKLKLHFANFDKVVKIRTTHNARTEGEWGFEHTKVVFNNEIIPFLKSLKVIFNVIDRDLLNEIMEVQTVFDQIDAAVQQSSVDKEYVLLTVMYSMSLIDGSVNVERKRNDSCDKCFNLEAELLKLQNTHNDLLKRSYLYMFKIHALMRLNLVRKRFPSHPKTMSRKLGLKCCKSKPTGNKKNDRFSRTPSRNMKNKSQLNANSELICATCKKSMFNGAHDMCLLDFVKNVNSHAKSAKKHEKQNIWKPTGHVYTEVGFKWKPTGRTFTIVGSKAKIVESKNANHSKPNYTWGSNSTDIPSSSLVMIGYPDCSLVSTLWTFKTHDRNRSQLMNFVSKFLGTIRFGNDHVAWIMGYGDYQLGNVTISKVYYIERLGHNLFSVGQFCDADLEVAFGKNTCSIRNLEGIDLISGSRDTNLSIISLDDMLKTSLICLLSKASKTKSWLWHRQSKDEAPEAIIKCIKNIQVRLNATVHDVRTDNGTEFVNQTLRKIYENVGILHQTSVARTPQQNGVVKRRNRTLVEAAHTMLIFSKAPLFLWAEAINIACYTQNRSLIRLRYNKTLYDLMQDKKSDLSFFHIFSALCYPTNDNEDLGKLDAKADIGIFIGYAPTKKVFRIYNKRTQIIIETIHVTFDKLTATASKQFNSGPGLHSMTPATSSSGLVPNLVSQ
nr:retrovirus-related Pol polyprotein from transposon TNT 1-94 [Tanacetum cinerariifolium]